MQLTTLAAFSAFVAVALAAAAPQTTPPANPQISYVETFSCEGNDADPATIPGIDRQMKWINITSTFGNNHDPSKCDGIRSTGDYYGAFTADSPVLMTIDASELDYDRPQFFDAYNFSFGCAANENLFDPKTQTYVNLFVPANCSLLAQGINEVGVVATQTFYYTTPEACTPDSIEQNYDNLVFYEFPSSFNFLQEIAFSVQAVPNKVTGGVTGYLDDVAYVETFPAPQ